MTKKNIFLFVRDQFFLFLQYSFHTMQLQKP